MGLGALALVSSGVAAPKERAGAQKPVDFNREIRPILSDNCFACHGPDEKQRKAKLRLDRHEDALKATKSGDYAIVPGDTKKSMLVERILSQDEDEVMPPPKSKKKLNQQQKDLLARWIAEGAPWPSHWSFEAPKRPALPEVKNKGWVRNEIDRFILARLEREKLKPSPEAEKTTLVRRAALDLTGDTRGSGCVPRRQITAGLREGGGSVAQLAALRRAHGALLARRGALRRFARVSHRFGAQHVEMARVGDQCVQQQHAV